jgi:hypothetical protein
LYSVKLDENNYFTGSYALVGKVDGGIEIPILPSTNNPVKAKFYKAILDESVTHFVEWFFDEPKYQAYVTEEAGRTPEPTLEEKITSLVTENETLKFDLKSTKEVVEMLLFGEV